MALRSFNILSLCSGAAGLDLGLKLAMERVRTVCYVERESYAAAVLVARMEDAALDRAPVWDDLSTFDGRPWRGVVDCITAGYPCQPFSSAGKRRGDQDERHLWPHVARIIDEVRPRIVFLENVANHLSLGFYDVRTELQDMGYTVAAGLYSAAEVGAPHERKRLFVLAYAGCECQCRQAIQPITEWKTASASGQAGQTVADAECCSNYAGPERTGWEARANPDRCSSWSDVDDSSIDGSRSVSVRSEDGYQQADAGRPGASMGDSRINVRIERRAGQQGQTEALEPSEPLWPPGPDDADGWQRFLEQRPGLEPAIRRIPPRMANRVDRLRLCGNGVVPVVAALAFVDLWRQLAV